MKKVLVLALLAAIFFTACKKDDSTDPSLEFNTAKDAAISDFVNKVAMPGYAELKVKANNLNTTITSLNSDPTEDNLAAAKSAWKDMRTTWERCEGFLFGPIEDNNYDPETDTWPVDFNDLDALLADNTQGLTVADIQTLPDALRGYHPIEYILWGEGGTRTAASLTARQKEYMVSLSSIINSIAGNLYNDWSVSGGNYSDKFLKAGKGSTVFVKKQSAFIAIKEGLLDICGEVGDGKMKDPYDLYLSNPTLAAQSVESPFSGNSVIDFKNNITGAYNAYLGKFNDDGTGISDLVKLKNSALDIELQQKFNAAIESFNSITLPYEQAIASQRTQCLNTMNAINELSETINTKLTPFITQYITD